MSNPFLALREDDGGIGGEEGKLPPVDNIVTWNIKGLNSLNKHEDVKIFLHDHQVGLVALPETQVKQQNIKGLLKMCSRVGSAI